MALGISLCTGLLVGLYPAWHASRTDVQPVLKEASRGAVGGRAAKRFRHTLVVAQISLSLTLLVSAGLLARSFRNLQTTELGFAAEGRVYGMINLPAARYATPESTREFYRQLQERLDTAPEIARGGAIFGLPLAGTGSLSPYSVLGRPVLPLHERPLASVRFVTAGYFDTIGIRLREGRMFGPDDRFGGEQVAIVNESFARKLFPGETALDRSFLIGLNADVPVRIVGVVRDVKSAGIAQPPPDEIYYPRDQRGGPFMAVVARGQEGLAPAAVIPVLRRLVASIDPSLALANPQTMEQLLAQSLGVHRLTMALLIAFAAIAALLAVVGVYSVMAYTVSQRTGEIGVRMALGASPGAILAMVLRTGVVLVAAGLLLGLLGSFGATRLLREALYQVPPFDPIIFALAWVALALAATLACVIPARRATQIDPTVALRAE